MDAVTFIVINQLLLVITAAVTFYVIILAVALIKAILTRTSN